MVLDEILIGADTEYRFYISIETKLDEGFCTMRIFGKIFQLRYCLRLTRRKCPQLRTRTRLQVVDSALLVVEVNVGEFGGRSSLLMETFTVEPVVTWLGTARGTAGIWRFEDVEELIVEDEIVGDDIVGEQLPA